MPYKEVKAVRSLQNHTNRKRRKAMIESGNSQCWYCGRTVKLNVGFDYKDIANQSTIDHLIPLTRGGSNEPENLVLACFSCNSKKRNRTVEEYRWLLIMQHPANKAITHLQAAIDLIDLPHVKLAIENVVQQIEGVAPYIKFYGEREAA